MRCISFLQTKKVTVLAENLNLYDVSHAVDESDPFMKKLDEYESDL